MTIHYHGTPITPRETLLKLAGRCFCVSYAHPSDVEVCHRIGQSVMLDNGAFSLWKSGTAVDWPGYYRWCERWLKYLTTWAIIPDTIDGGVEENDRLIAEWPHGNRGAPVWHLDEPIERLIRLCSEWQRVCIGSSGEYADVGSLKWHIRMTDAMNQLCGNGPPPAWLHMLRGMQCVKPEWPYPFASVDSTDVARNHHRSDARKMVERWDGMQCQPVWTVSMTQQSLF